MLIDDKHPMVLLAAYNRSTSCRVGVVSFNGGQGTRRQASDQTRTHGTTYMAYILYDRGWDMIHALHQL
jgi:hypothetical protein